MFEFLLAFLLLHSVFILPIKRKKNIDSGCKRWTVDHLPLAPLLTNQPINSSSKRGYPSILLLLWKIPVTIEATSRMLAVCLCNCLFLCRPVCPRSLWVCKSLLSPFYLPWRLWLLEVRDPARERHYHLLSCLGQSSIHNQLVKGQLHGC